MTASNQSLTDNIIQAIGDNIEIVKNLSSKYLDPVSQAEYGLEVLKLVSQVEATVASVNKTAGQYNSLVNNQTNKQIQEYVEEMVTLLLNHQIACENVIGPMIISYNNRCNEIGETSAVKSNIDIIYGACESSSSSSNNTPESDDNDANNDSHEATLSQASENLANKLEPQTIFDRFQIFTNELIAYTECRFSNNNNSQCNRLYFHCHTNGDNTIKQSGSENGGSDGAIVDGKEFADLVCGVLYNCQDTVARVGICLAALNMFIDLKTHGCERDVDQSKCKKILDRVVNIPYFELSWKIPSSE
ncbi:hypothetical protein H4219_005856 [Mycoemilia scoparia]|uniref:Uncharacterized protein n=1 Tax=Mycoemilia scoparia TaxID=417184 RepID=A0A9W8DP78_9FUNG|nr:hypothetical protein H4219_005856 [Mycoemilia scoparia]